MINLLAGKTNTAVPLVSIIIPIYNSEDYLSRCLDSCINQDFDNYEIIAVDNGSSDSSAAILEKYAELFPERISYYTIEHALRAGRPRNFGRSVAKADYICFVDSDDELFPTALSTLFSCIDETTYDFVASPHYNVTDGVFVPCRCLGEKITSISKEQCNLGVEPAPWAKMFRATFLDSVGNMPEDFSFEDLAWFFVYFTKARAIGYVNTFTYVHYMRDGSEVRGISDTRITESVKAENYGLEFCNQDYRDLVVAHIAMRARINISHRWMFSDYFMNQLQDKWSEIEKNKFVIKNQTLFDFLKRAKQYSENLSDKIVYVNGFNYPPKAERIRELEKGAFFDGCTVCVLDEQNCDVSPSSAVYRAYENKDFAFVAFYYAIKMIQQTGGVYIDDSIVLDVPLNFVRHLNAFFCSQDDQNFTTALFGGKKDEVVFGYILDTFQHDPDTGYSVAERIKNVLFQEFKLTPCFESKIYAAQVSTLSPYIHYLQPLETVSVGSKVHLCHVDCGAPNSLKSEGGPSETKVVSLLQRIPRIDVVNSIVVCLSCSNQYSAYCGTVINSIIENSSPENFYDILILELDISRDNKRRLLSLASGHSNVSIRLVNLKVLSLYFDFNTHSHFRLEGSLKLFLFSQLFEAYDKIVVLDSDLIVERDIADLYHFNLGNNIMAACDDVIMKKMIAEGDISRGLGKGMPVSDYVTDYLCMGSCEHYYNTGVVVFSLDLARQIDTFKKAVRKLNSRPYWFLEQDVLNELLGNRTAALDNKWNVLTGSNDIDSILRVLDVRLKKDYEQAVAAPSIIHFAGSKKPWLDPTVEYADTFFKYCRKTFWYEEIVYKYTNNQSKIEQMEKDIRNLSSSANRRLAKNQLDTKNLSLSVDRRLTRVERRSPLVRLKNALKRINANQSSSLKRFYEFVLPRHTIRREFVRALIGKKRMGLFIHYIVSHVRIVFLPLRQWLPWSLAFNYKSKIRKYRDKYANERCFFIGNGPSLSPSDLNKLSGEYTFAFNRIFNVFDKTDWRPTFYMYQDVMLNHGKQFVDIAEDGLVKSGMPLSFFPITPAARGLKGISNHEVFLPIVENWSNYIKDKRYLRFSKDCTKSVEAAYTSMYTALQLAIYMGFSEIYIVGADCDYSSKGSHFYTDDFDKKKTKGDIKKDTDSVTKGYKIMRDAIDKIDGITIFNASRGGKLELFPRVNLDDVLEVDNSSKDTAQNET